MRVVEVTVTGPEEWIRSYAKLVLDDQLVACSQVSPIDSRYWWQGAIEEAKEVRVVFHTRDIHVAELIRRTESEHPYDVSCVFSSALETVSETYAEWISSSVRDYADA